MSNESAYRKRKAKKLAKAARKRERKAHERRFDKILDDIILRKAEAHSTPPTSTQPGRPVKPRLDSKPGIPTPRTNFTLPDCRCSHPPAWEHCSHSEPRLFGPELSHIQSIQKE